MSDYVEQCRREWKRLGVSDPLADEMAVDLASDLSEAEAEGVSPEELLGRSAFDPPSFAATWAAERGIIPEQPSPTNARRRPLFLMAFTGVAAITLTVAAALLLTGEPKLTLATSGAKPRPLARVVVAAPLPPEFGGQVHSVSAATPVEWMLLGLAIIALGFAAWLWSVRGRSHPPTASAQ
jgi:hypothetical protein